MLIKFEYFTQVIGLYFINGSVIMTTRVAISCQLSRLIPLFLAGRWHTVYVRSCWSTDWYVQIQVQTDETSSNVQRSQARHLLQIQHREFNIYLYVAVRSGAVFHVGFGTVLV